MKISIIRKTNNHCDFITKRVLLIFFLCLAATPNDSAAQEFITTNQELPAAEENISVDFEDISLDEAMIKIGQKSRSSINYNADLFGSSRKITFRATNVSLSSLLEKILPANITYDVFGSSIILQKVNSNDTDKGFVQEIITGQVKDAQTGEPLPGVNILVENTGRGTSTNSEGEFELEVEGLEETLIVTYIGYERLEIPLQGRNELDIELTPTVISGAELVVVGYGLQERDNIVGSIGKVDVEGIVSRPSADIGSSLQGTVPGLNIRSTSGGDPSETPEINIRGFNSINGGSPLVLVDGIEENLANINPNDVESVTVLKDAQAASVYGARGSFGAVLVTTKSGKEGEFEVTYSNNVGFTTNTTRTDFVTNPYTYAKWADGAIGSYHSGCYVCYEGEDWEIAEQVGNGEREPFYELQPDGTYKFFESNDHYDLLFKDRRPHVSQNISVSGGSEKLRGFLSGRIYRRDKIQNIQDAEMRRYNFQLNLTAVPYEWLEISAINRFSSRYDEQYAGTKNGWGGTLGASKWRDLFPNYPAFVDGYGVSVGRSRNGYVGRLGALNEGAASRQWQYEKQTYTLKLRLTPIEILELNMDYNYSVDRTDRTFSFTPFSYLSGNELALIENAGLNRVSEDRWRDDYNALNIYGTLDKSVADAHNFKLMLGFNQEVFERDRVGATIEELLTKDKSNISFGTEMLDMSGSTLDWALQGFFGRFNYNYDDKYLLEVASRYDASSRFPEDKRWGFFPSAGIGWQVDNEDFWSSALDNVVSSFKLKASYGKLGNQNVGVNTFRELIRLGRTSWLVDGQEVNYAGAPQPLPSNIAWEKITSANVGADMGFLEDRITASVELYQRTTSDMYLPGEPLPAVFGASEPRRNYASLRNRGFEVIVGYNDQFNVLGSALSFNVQANISNNKGVITKFDNPNGLLSSFWEGQQIGEIWGYRIDGQFQSDEEAAAFQNQYGAENLYRVYRGILDYGSNTDWNYLKGGDLKYVDVNGDGVIDNGDNTLENPGDLERIGNAMPQFPFGFSINANWKNIDVSLLGQGVAKQHWYPSGPLYWGTFHRPYVSFIRKDMLDKVWDPEHPNDPNRVYPQRQRAYNALSNGRMSANVNDYHLTNIGYLRLKNLTVGYSLPAGLIEKANLKRFRVYLSGENLLTWSFGGLTDYLDPEEVGAHVSYSNPNNVQAKSARDTQLYPMGRTFSAGLEITF